MAATFVVGKGTSYVLNFVSMSAICRVSSIAHILMVVGITHFIGNVGMLPSMRPCAATVANKQLRTLSYCGF